MNRTDSTAPGGFDEALFDPIAERERGHFWYEPRRRLLVGLAQRYFPQAQRYLEVGCGAGFVLAAFARARPWGTIIGTDPYAEALAHARRRVGPAVDLKQASVGEIGALGAFDLIGAYDVLEHIEDDAAAIRSVRAALVPGGGFIASVPQHPFLWSGFDDIARHVRRYRRGELEAKLRRADFDILFSTSYVTLALPLMLVSRIGRTGANVLQRETTPSAWINGPLRAMLECEVSASLAGLRWPVGGSRVVVARKKAR